MQGFVFDVVCGGVVWCVVESCSTHTTLNEYRYGVKNERMREMRDRELRVPVIIHSMHLETTVIHHLVFYKFNCEGMMPLLLTFAKVFFQWILALLCCMIVLHRCGSFLHRQIRRRQQQLSPSIPSSTNTTTTRTKHQSTTTSQNNNNNNNKNEIVLAFFHPYCTGGGGGERVVWKMIQVLGEMIPPPRSSEIRNDHDTLQHKYHSHRNNNNNNNKATTIVSFHSTILIYTIDPPTVTYSEGTPLLSRISHWGICVCVCVLPLHSISTPLIIFFCFVLRGCSIPFPFTHLFF